MYDSVAVLHVEPDAAEALMLAGALRDIWPGAFRMSHASSVADALDRMAVGDLDCVLLSLDMPDRPGLEGLEAVLDHAPALPVIATTEHDDDELGLLAVETGAQDHLVRGADAYRVGRALRYAVERKRVENGLLDIARVHESAVLALREGVIVGTRDGDVTSVNPAVAGLLGISPEAARTLDLLDPAWEPVHADGSPMPADELPTSRALVTGQPQDDVIVGLRRPDGSRAWFMLSARPLRRLGEAEPYGTVTSLQRVAEGAEALAG